MVKQGRRSSVNSGDGRSRKTSSEAQQTHSSDQSLLAPPVAVAVDEQQNSFSGQTQDLMDISQMPTGPGPLHLAAKYGRLE